MTLPDSFPIDEKTPSPEAGSLLAMSLYKMAYEFAERSGIVIPTYTTWQSRERVKFTIAAREKLFLIEITQQYLDLEYIRGEGEKRSIRGDATFTIFDFSDINTYLPSEMLVALRKAPLPNKYLGIEAKGGEVTSKKILALSQDFDHGTYYLSHTPMKGGLPYKGGEDGNNDQMVSDQVEDLINRLQQPL